MGNSLDELASYMKPLAQKLLDQAGAAGVPCRVISTLRTPAEQAIKIATGVSWSDHSKHLPQPPENLAEAIDLCPLAILNSHSIDWEPENPAWLTIGLIGESLGLRWGGRWKQRDMGHFEFVHPTQPLSTA